jgi:N-acetylglucosamine-6-phosphate deacetylase
MKAFTLFIVLLSKSVLSDIAFINAEIFTGFSVLKDHVLIVKSDRIDRILPAIDFQPLEETIIDCQNRRLIPGFIDLQVNGGGGVLFNDSPTVSGIQSILNAHHPFGTVALLPTLISDGLSVVTQAMSAVESAIKQQIPGVLGIHLEGPFISKTKKGIHNEKHIQLLYPEYLKQLCSLDNGKTLITLAPEAVDPPVINMLSANGIKVFLGHTNADYEMAKTAIRNGVIGFTHLFNAMSPLRSRSPNAVGAALDDKDCYCSIINDGFHLHPAIFRVAAKVKKDKLLLVTDAMSTVGIDKKSFQLTGQTIFEDNGRLTNAEGRLAGSALTMIGAVKNAIKFGITWDEAVRMASLYPATCLGITDDFGSLSPGKKASFLILDNEFNIQSVWIEGNVFSQH